MPNNDGSVTGAADAPATDGASGAVGQNLTSATANGSQAVATPAGGGSGDTGVSADTGSSVGAGVPTTGAPVGLMPANPMVTGASVTDPTAVGVQNVADGKSLTGADSELLAEVARKIGEAHNVLVALSGNPSVDEMAAAIGLTLYLDKLGKKATAIYSGETPNALEFLKPEETFETSADVLQDFVIALNKDKADHLRYKLDGDYVKIYITPYKSRVSQEDLNFSYDDYNVDLVLALDVANGVDLDSALREHGRIMHDSVIINITTGNPGKLGEIEWSDKRASSVSEMIARLLYKMNVNGEVKIEKDEATAFLTGIVAATDRFSNAGTTPETMRIASKLMESGANQQLVSKNITSDVENEMFNIDTSKKPSFSSDPVNLAVEHDGDDGDAEWADGDKNEKIEQGDRVESNGAKQVDGDKNSDAKKNGAEVAEGAKKDEVTLNIADKGEGTPGSDGDELVTEPKVETSPQINNNEVETASSQTREAVNEKSTEDNQVEDAETTAILDDLKAAEMSLAAAGVGTMPDKVEKPIDIKDVGGNGAVGAVADSANDVGNANGVGSVAGIVGSGAGDVGGAVGITNAITSNNPVGAGVAAGGGAENIVSMPVGIPVVSTEINDGMKPNIVNGVGADSEANTAIDAGMSVVAGANNGGEGGLLGVTHDEAKYDGENGVTAGAMEEGFMKETPEKVIQPPTDGSDVVLPTVAEDENKYGKMLEEALAGLNETGDTNTASVASGTMSIPASATGSVNTNVGLVGNPAAMSAPSVAVNPEINGVPEINYMPMPGDSVLPPPPTPPIDTATPMPTIPAMSTDGAGVPGNTTRGAVTPIAPATPVTEPTPTSLGSQPAMQDQVYRPQAADPSAFKIPGM